MSDPTSTPDHGCNIIYLDGLIIYRLKVEQEVDRLRDEIKRLVILKDRIENLLMSIASSHKQSRIYDPRTGTAIKITMNARNEPAAMTAEDCALSTQIVLSDDQRQKLAEIMGTGAPEGGQATIATPAPATHEGHGEGLAIDWKTDPVEDLIARRTKERERSMATELAIRTAELAARHSSGFGGPPASLPEDWATGDEATLEAE
jgi:hypothetical protein